MRTVIRHTVVAGSAVFDSVRVLDMYSADFLDSKQGAGVKEPADCERTTAPCLDKADDASVHAAVGSCRKEVASYHGHT